MAAIAIGLPAINRTASTGSGRTWISKDTPANASGIITDVEIWCLASISGCKVGTFYVVSGTTLKCRDSADIGDVPSGAKRTFSGLSIAVEAGDLIGTFYSDGNIELDPSGHAGIWWTWGEHCDPNDQAVYSQDAGDGISLHGIGEEPAALGRSQAIIIG
ncbi:hypothetical protein ES703_79251 [subsurface metagenome]